MHKEVTAVSRTWETQHQTLKFHWTQGKCSNTLLLSDPGPTPAPLHSALPQLLFGACSHPAHGVAEAFLTCIQSCRSIFVIISPNRTLIVGQKHSTASFMLRELSNSNQLVPKQDNPGSLSYCCQSSTACHSNPMQLSQSLCWSQSTASGLLQHHLSLVETFTCQSLGCAGKHMLIPRNLITGMDNLAKMTQ